MILGNFRTRTLLNRALIAGLGSALLAGTASAQQLTDASLISNKDWDAGGNPGYVLTFDSDSTWKINSNSAGATRIDTDWNPYAQDQWHLVVGTFDRDGNISAYQNGAFISSDPMQTGSIDTFASGLDLNIGQDGTGTYGTNTTYPDGRGFLGLVDDVAVWRRALAADEISFIYNQAINSSNPLGAITSLNGDGGATSNLIGTDLVGYYAFEGNANDTSGSTNINNGAWTGTEQYVAGQFGGQAAKLNSTSFITIGDDAAFPADYTFGDETGSDFTFMAWVFEAGPPKATWQGGSGDNFATVANWDLNPGVWDDSTITIIETNPGGNPIVVDATTGEQVFGAFILGKAGETLSMNVSGGRLLGIGGTDTTIGVENSTVNINLTGGELSHFGAGEENSEMDIAKAGSTVNINMSGDSVFAVGTFEIDPTYAIGSRRPLTTDSPMQDRVGDDMKLGNGGDVVMTMTDNAFIFVTDVFYPVDSSTGSLDMTMSGNAEIAVGWDTRWFDSSGADNGKTITWTMNGNSKFKVARDHGLGEANTSGSIVININDNALLYAGGRIALGAGFTGDVTLNQTGGTVQVGSPVGSPGIGGALTVDDTGEDATGTVRDGIIWMGEGANSSTYNLSGGNVEVTRFLFVGADGTATFNQTGGVVNIYGTGVSGPVDGNDTVGIPIDEWVDGGGDLVIGRQEGDLGTYNHSAGQVNIARNLVIAFASSLSFIDPLSEIEGGTGIYNVSGNADLNVSGGIAVGGDGFGTFSVRGGNATVDTTILALGGIAGTENGTGTLQALITGASHTAINNTGNTLLQNNAELSVEIDVTYGIYRPTNGTSFVLVNHAGVGGDAGTFSSITGPEADGIDWSFAVTAGQITVTADTVYAPGDTDFDGDIDDSDLGTAFASYNGPIGAAGGSNFASGDADGDGDVDDSDLGSLFAGYTGPLSPNSVPEPTSLALLTLGGLLVARRRRSA